LCESGSVATVLSPLPLGEGWGEGSVIAGSPVPVAAAKAGVQGLGLEPSSSRNLPFRLHSVSSSCGGRVTFLLRGQEKSNQKRRPPRRFPLRGLSTPPQRRTGAPVERRASCAHFGKAKSRIKSRAESSRAQAKAKASRLKSPLDPIGHCLHHHRAEMHQLRQWKRQFDTAALLRCLRVADLVGLHLRQYGA